MSHVLPLIKNAWCQCVFCGTVQKTEIMITRRSCAACWYKPEGGQ